MVNKWEFSSSSSCSVVDKYPLPVVYATSASTLGRFGKKARIVKR